VLTSNWYNPPQSTQAAETLAKNGADVIAKHEDSIGPLLGAKAAHVWGIGSEADTSAQTPDTYLTGSVYDWRSYSERKYREAQAGNFTNEEVNGDLKSGLVRLGPINAKVSPDVKKKVLDAEAKIKSGELVVFKGPISSNKGQLKLPQGKQWTSPADVYQNMTFFERGIIGNVQK
jgi:basic membrane lipoprotein Med (substrate-binding protein (PBP1-ABC) superfamily)